MMIDTQMRCLIIFLRAFKELSPSEMNYLIILTHFIPLDLGRAKQSLLVSNIQSKVFLISKGVLSLLNSCKDKAHFCNRLLGMFKVMYLKNKSKVFVMILNIINESYVSFVDLLRHMLIKLSTQRLTVLFYFVLIGKRSLGVGEKGTLLERRDGCA